MTAKRSLLTHALRLTEMSLKMTGMRNCVRSTGSTPSDCFEREDLKRRYDEAIRALNSLQTNAEVLQRTIKERQKNVHMNLPLTRQFLERSGMSLNDLDKMNVIHVSGTKGKGSTCAFCESILRQHGLKTGFYSSPHLISATERIRLNGVPISREKFIRYFWQVFHSVCSGRSDSDRPAYFKFMTILAFNIFWREKVDVAIIEVGIGGEYDCTNIIRKPLVTGITALGIDHTSILGKSISEIAWHKAGIMKPGVQTYIDGEQQEEALQVIRSRAESIGSTVAAVPEITDYHWGRFPVVLGLYGKVQERNASLALALAHHTLAVMNIGNQEPPDVLPGDEVMDQLLPFPIQAESALGLRLTDWPGRTQVIDHGRIKYFLDGAHTEESIMACRSWFSVASKVCLNREVERSVFRVLLFNTTGDRDASTLLLPFVDSNLDLVIFCTNLCKMPSKGADQENFTTTEKIQLKRCENMLHMWSKLQQDQVNQIQIMMEHDHSSKPPVRTPVPGIIIPNINDALLWICQGTDPHLMFHYHTIPSEVAPKDLREASQVQVLVTGSLHLVGGVLACIQGEEAHVRQVDPQLVAAYHQLMPHHRVNSIPGMT